MTAATNTKASRATLKHLAIAVGFDSLAALADAANVPSSVVYQANTGSPPGAESAKKIVDALNKRLVDPINEMRWRSTKSRVTIDELLDVVEYGARQRAMRRRPGKK
jgi:predicted transcriptional regulator